MNPQAWTYPPMPSHFQLVWILFSSGLLFFLEARIWYLKAGNQNHGQPLIRSGRKISLSDRKSNPETDKSEIRARYPKFQAHAKFS